MDEHPVFRSHNVYILGAGFSRDAGLPLILDFLDQMRDGVDWIAEQGTPEEQKAMQEVFKFRHWAAGSAQRVKIDLENIEELFSLASASERDSGNDYVPRAIAATLRYARSKTPRSYRATLASGELSAPPNWQCENSSAIQETYRMSVYDFYAGIISGKFCKPVRGMRNTVISFNYDTLLEDSLAALGMPFSYELPLSGATYHPLALEIERALIDPEAIRVLKLHGSVNWGINRVSETESTLSVYLTYKELLEDGKHPYLLPPTWRKVFAGALAQVLIRALDAIRDASRIIIIGSSLAPTDLYFKYLLAGGLRDNISLRDIFFVTQGDYSSLEQNVLELFQPSFAKRVHWYAQGVQQAMIDGMFLQKIDRSKSSIFRSLDAY